MIALLVCSINLYASDIDVNDVYEIQNTNVTQVECDSVYISFDDLRIVNSKLIELNYEKEINDKLRKVIDNDKVIINNYKALNEKVNKDCKKAILQRNIFIGVGVATTICAILCIIL